MTQATQAPVHHWPVDAYGFSYEAFLTSNLRITYGNLYHKTFVHKVPLPEPENFRKGYARFVTLGLRGFPDLMVDWLSDDGTPLSVKIAMSNLIPNGQLPLPFPAHMLAENQPYLGNPVFVVEVIDDKVSILCASPLMLKPEWVKPEWVHPKSPTAFRKPWQLGATINAREETGHGTRSSPGNA